MSAQAAEFVRDWRKANCRAWLMQLERTLNRMLKRPQALFSRRLEAQRTEQGNRAARARAGGGPSPPRLLRPPWTAFLTILRAVLVPSLIS